MLFNLRGLSGLGKDLSPSGFHGLPEINFRMQFFYDCVILLDVLINTLEKSSKSSRVGGTYLRYFTVVYVFSALYYELKELRPSK